MFARFDENPAMTLQDIKETKCYGRTDTRTHGRTDNVKTVYPPQTKFAGGIIRRFCFFVLSLGVVSFYHNIQPSLSGLLYQYQKDIALISRP